MSTRKRAFLSRDHLDEIREVEDLWKGISKLSAVARRYGIEDIFQDNGAKVLQQLVYMNLIKLPGRVGNDAIDEFGLEWEMKSANEELVGGFSTHHHLTHQIIEKYREAHWLFTIYSHTALREMYVLDPSQLEPIFQTWIDHLEGKKVYRGKVIPKMASLNNPKIPFAFVRKHGVQVYPFDPNKPFDPKTLWDRVRSKPRR